MRLRHLYVYIPSPQYKCGVENQTMEEYLWKTRSPDICGSCIASKSNIIVYCGKKRKEMLYLFDFTMCFLNRVGFCQLGSEVQDRWKDYCVYVAPEREGKRGGEILCLFVIVSTDESSSEVLNSTLHFQLNTAMGLQTAQ